MRKARIRVPPDVEETFHKLRLDEHTPERISEITGFPAHIVKHVLREYEKRKPSK